MNIDIPIRRVREDALLPAYAHGSEEDAGVDLTYCGGDAVSLQPGARHAFTTGLALQLPSGYEGQVRPRSGLARHKGVTVLNSPGTIDPGYRGEVSVILINLSGEIQTIEPGERIAQLVIARYAAVNFVPAEDLTSSKRGAGGFGSTGTR